MYINKLKPVEIFIILAVVYLVIRLPILTIVPFIQDEAFYSVMIEEQIAHPTTVMTLFDYQVGWKPPLFFWASAFFVQLLRDLPIPIEAVYRLPNLLFGLINVFLAYFIFQKITRDNKHAFLMAIAYLATPLLIQSELRVMTDVLCGTFILAGALSYLNGTKDSRFFLLGGIFTILAYFTKQINAAVIPVVAVAYLFQNDRKKIASPLFLISLAALPLATVMEDTMFRAAPGALVSHFAKTSILDKLGLKEANSSMETLIPLTTIWLFLSLFGFWKNWKENLAMSVWYCLSIFPLIAGTWMPWYFYPVMVPMIYFSFKFLSMDGKQIKLDRLFYLVFFMCTVICLIFGVAYHLNYRQDYMPQKNAGEFLAGKQNVLILGYYAPAIPAYKMLEEKRATGKWLDYGYLIIEKNETAEKYQSLIDDYRFNDSEIIDGNFQSLFAELDMVYRKDTNITKFDYICIIHREPFDVNISGKVVFQDGFVRVYDMR